MMNQDPRFSATILGVAGQEISREYFMANLQPGLDISVVGFMVGEHLQMAQEIEVGMYDPSAGIVMSADRFRVQLEDGFIQFQRERFSTLTNSQSLGICQQWKQFLMSRLQKRFPQILTDPQNSRDSMQHVGTQQRLHIVGPC